MNYIAHKTENARTQSVLDHLTETAELAKQNAVPLMQELAYAAGLAHDIGKYSQAFQDRIQSGSNEKYEHALPGALEYYKQFGKPVNPLYAMMLMYCIAGHHTGIPDGGNMSESPDDSASLGARLNRAARYTGSWDYQAFRQEVTLSVPQEQTILMELMQSLYQPELDTFYEQFAFLTRYLFSCLTDADYIDTERFCSPERERCLKSDFQSAERAVQKRLNSFIAETSLQKARTRLQAQAFANTKGSSAISILQMPVGSGKTLCSLEIALQKAIHSCKKRIIYVIPYTSIIEQTAAEFERLIGKDTAILQHHSNYVFEDHEDEEEPDTAEKLRLASENWDAPVIVTTNVQFFESLYHYKSSRLRKLHNLADSVIIFDEIHMLPVELLQPCLRAVGYVTKYLNSEAIFLSATMPDYEKLFKKYAPGLPARQLITDTSDFACFRKCRYHDLGETDPDSIAEKAAEYRSSLIIVNKRRTAYELYQQLGGTKFHLSTYMTPHDRSDVIAKIRKKLKAEEPFTVVSTSLIEAGVDLDFQAVFRELTGLDSILQSAGRCNREGKLESGDVFIYETGEKLTSEIQVRAAITKDLLRQYEDIESAECIRTYYDRLFEQYKQVIEEKNLGHNRWQSTVSRKTGFVSIPFRSYANNFKMIQDDSTGIIINNCDETEQLLKQSEFGDITARRKLQQYTVSLRKYELGNAMKSGILTQRGGMFVLSDTAYYNHDTGLLLDAANDKIL